MPISALAVSILEFGRIETGRDPLTEVNWPIRRSRFLQIELLINVPASRPRCVTLTHPIGQAARRAVALVGLVSQPIPWSRDGPAGQRTSNGGLGDVGCEMRAAPAIHRLLGAKILGKGAPERTGESPLPMKQRELNMR